jgi:hypothetical protein
MMDRMILYILLSLILMDDQQFLYHFHPPPPLKKHAQLVDSIDPHALPKAFKSKEPYPSKGKWPSHFVDSNQSQAS